MAPKPRIVALKSAPLTEGDVEEGQESRMPKALPGHQRPNDGECAFEHALDEASECPEGAEPAEIDDADAHRVEHFPSQVVPRGTIDHQ